MPSYQCPHCRNHFTVESDDVAVAACPHCQTVAAERAWYYKIGVETIGPVSRNDIDDLLNTPIQIRQGDGDWQVVGKIAEPSDDMSVPDHERDADPDIESTGISLWRALTILVILGVAFSGWAYHFAAGHRDSNARSVVQSDKKPTKKSSKRKAIVQKKPADIAKSVVKPIAKNVAKPKRPLKVSVEDLRMEIHKIDQHPRKIVVRVTVKDPTVWQQVKAAVSSEIMADLLTLREMSDRELKAGPIRKRKLLRRRGPDHGPILGTIRVKGPTLEFWPAADLLPGERYKATFDPTVLNPNSGFPQEAIVKHHTVGPARPRLVAIHPLSRELPGNVDQFHIIFSEPMQRDNALSHLRLNSPLQADDEFDWKPLQPKLLWSKDGRSCTIRFDNKNKQSEPLLNRGVRYRLTVSGEWKSEQGQHLGRDISKFLTGVDPDTSSPKPANWTISFPKRGGKKLPIRCKMRELIDWVSWNREARIVDAAGLPVAGSFAFLSGGTVWNYYPDDAWKGGDYRLLIGDRLRDLCGNMVAGDFTSDPKDSRKKWIVIPFHVKDND